ncbi:mechanosensitive ion channel family protein [Halorussus salinisoli]|uniref:mechanosensitive ion channel family protein n=1 Tax=Halorussus salinisoli TaxID=2558242 RepID=UPI002A90F46F|nr:mechanosensitive ion channel domain-containing protein [Halorussus salinisoli]
MKVIQDEPLAGIVTEALAELRAGFVDAIPTLITALLFVVVAYATIKISMTLVRSALGRIYADELVADLFTAVVGVFLWFGAALTLLKILGMGDIAASLGTATGFIALGISYALSDMIADTVSGVYLLRDPDFNPGDTVEASDVTGVVREIDLRKTRLEVEGGDTVVLGNSSVEEKWTKKTDAETKQSESEAVPTGVSEASGESVTDEARKSPE